MVSDEFDDSFLTVAEVAELLRLNQQTVRNWIDAGSLPAVRVGRRVRIKKSDLNRVLESGYQGSSASASSIPGPNATDFWSGGPVGVPESAPHSQSESETKAMGPGGGVEDREDDETVSPPSTEG